MCLAIPGKILEVTGDDPLWRMARVQFGGIVKAVNLAYTPEAQTGDYVMVHVGFALSVVDEAEARLVFSYLEMMNELAEIEPGRDIIPDVPNQSEELDAGGVEWMHAGNGVPTKDAGNGVPTAQ